MNEQIRLLAEEAKISNYLSAYGSEFKYAFEKFAQLMIRDCANIAYNTQYNHGRASYETGSCERAIKQHFGVAE